MKNINSTLEFLNGWKVELSNIPNYVRFKKDFKES